MFKIQKFKVKNMKKILMTSALAALALMPASAQKVNKSSGGYPITPVPFTSVKVWNNTFWGQRIETSRKVTIPLAFSKCETEGRYKNFERAAHPSDTYDVGKLMPYSFDDTDPYKTIATGVYIYVNHELDDCYVFNAAYRFACVYRFFTLDITAGIGVPLESSNYDDAFIVVDKVYWRGGFNMLIGNAYTTSLFIQGGISDIPFTKRDEKFEFDEEKTYLLFEPRFRGKKCQVDVTAFSLPEDTVKDFIFINDTLGMNINIYTDNLYFKNKMFLFGINASLTFPDKGGNYVSGLLH